MRVDVESALDPFEGQTKVTSPEWSKPMKSMIELWRGAKGASVPLTAVGLIALATACISDVGQPCTSDGDCIFGQSCLTEAEGFPGGYCTSENCDVDGCAEGSECFEFPVDGETRTICLLLCDYQLECSRPEYDCYDVDNNQVCLPADGAGGNQPPAGSVGASCTDDPQCDDGVCLTNLPSGYCSSLCDSDSDCATGSHCEQIGTEGFCYDDCENQADCRSGYECASADLAAPSCVKSENRVVKNPNGDQDGSTCLSDINCMGGVCTRETEGYPGGYCSTLDCDTNTDCNGGVCTVQSSNTVCKAPCSADSDCRTDYECVNGSTPSNSAVGYCQPTAGATAGAAPSSTSGDIEIDCQNGDSLNFTLPSGSIGFYIAPFSSDGDDVLPTRLTGPNGIDLDLINDFNFFSLNPQLLVSIAPLVFPGSNNSNWEGDRTDWSGDFTLEVDSNSSELCYYVLPKTQPGTTLDINFYLAGVPGVSASSAPSDSNFQSMVSAMSRIYGSAGITLGNLTYRDLSSTDTQRYQILRDFNDVFRLVATSQDPTTFGADRISVNVFLIEDFNIPEVPGLLGISPGLPGVSGFHGTTGAGLVFSSVNLDGSATDMGQTMAHEIGHFLGLRHTSEHGGSAHDPITDTPECSDPEKATACADHTNFMFPFSISGVRQEDISDGQQYVLQRAALVK